MADFRKWFLVLAVLAIVAMPVSAQVNFGCSASTTAGGTPTIRDGGLTELVGQVQLTCSGGSGDPITTNIQIFMSPTQVTNRVKAGTAAECPTGIACVTDAVLQVQNSAGTVTGNIVGLLQSNLAAGDTPASRNSILFPGITLPQGTTTTIRISNVRVVAPPVSNIAIPTQVFEFVSTNPTTIPISPATNTVAFVQPGMQFAAKALDGQAAASLSFTQCVSQNASIKTIDFLAKFTEVFPGAFKTQDTAPFSETGPVSTVTPVALTAIGGTTAPSNVATTGTELLVRFSNIPAGVRIFVTDTPVLPATPDNFITGPAISALLQDTSGASASLSVASFSSSTNSTNSIAATSAHEVAISSGSGAATWMITQNTPVAGVAQKNISFGVAVVFTANTSAGLPGLTGSTPGSVSGTFAPVSTVDFAATASTAPIPRFRDNPTGASVFSIVPCVTNLLFPFITNQAGFDTGIALVNTSLDNAGNKLPFNTATQHGTCTVNYFNGTTTAPAPQVTPDIVAGGTFAFTLQGGGVPGSTSSAAGFQGYAIARCNFQFAHGFAFISDRNTPSLGSQGYLALVIPDRTRTASPLSTSTTGQGEQLGM